MRRWIRVQGLAAFFVVVALLTLAGWFLSGPALKRGIEAAGTAVVGARVEVARASLGLSPLGLSVTGLEVTNPSRPMENALQVRRIVLALEPQALLRRKVVVREMAAEGMEFGTPRATSGALPDRPRAETADKGEGEGAFSLPPMKVPPVAEILAQEKLVSVERVEALKRDAQEAEARIRERAASLPDRARAEAYQKRLEKLLSGSGLDPARVREAKELREEIRLEGEKISGLGREVTASVADLRTRLNGASGWVTEDVARLKEKYALTPGGLANITRALFGDAAGGWADRGVQALRLLSYIPSRPGKGSEPQRPPRGKGVDVPLREDNPTPDLWVKRAALSLRVPSGFISGQALDFASEPWITGRPAQLTFEGRDLPGGASLEAAGTIDRTVPGAPRDDLRLSLSGWKVQDFVLSGGSLPVTLNQGQGTLSGSVVLAGEAVDGAFTVNLSAVRLQAGGDSDTPLARSMRSTLGEVRELKVEVRVDGTLDDYGVRLSSDLDRILREAVGRAAREESDRLEAALKNSIDGKVEPLKAQARDSLARLESVGQELKAVKARLDDALKAKASPKLPF